MILCHFLFSDLMLLTGGYVHSDSLISYLSSIYELDTNTSEWSLVAEMRVARAYHGVSVTAGASVAPFCVNKVLIL